MLLETPAQAETTSFQVSSSDISGLINTVDWPQDLFRDYEDFMMNSCL